MLNASEMLSSDSDLASAASAASADCTGGPTEEEAGLYLRTHFWIEVVLQSAVGIGGFGANLVVIPILCSEKMRSIFNRLLACLVLLDNAYLLLTLLETLRRSMDVVSAFNVAYCYALYPLRNVALSCTVYAAVALAIERYKAIRHPIQYHNANAGVNTWRKVLLCYVLPVVAAAVVVNLPKFWEVEIRYVSFVDEQLAGSNATAGSSASVLVAMPFPSSLRFNHNYVLWYMNVARLLLTGLIPFSLLVYLNLSVLSVIRRRRHMQHRFVNVHSKRLKAEAARQAHVLFAVCTVFFVGHAPRIVLNIHEFFVLDDYLRELRGDCLAVAFWTLMAGSVSHLFLAVNSSVNIVVYCLFCQEFRTLFVLQLKTLFAGATRSSGRRSGGGATSGVHGDSMASTPVVNLRTTSDDGGVTTSSRRHAQARANLMLLVPEVTESFCERGTDASLGGGLSLAGLAGDLGQNHVPVSLRSNCSSGGSQTSVLSPLCSCCLCCNASMEDDDDDVEAAEAGDARNNSSSRAEASVSSPPPRPSLLVTAAADEGALRGRWMPLRRLLRGPATSTSLSSIESAASPSVVPGVDLVVRRCSSDPCAGFELRVPSWRPNKSGSNSKRMENAPVASASANGAAVGHMTQSEML